MMMAAAAAPAQGRTIEARLLFSRSVRRVRARYSLDDYRAYGATSPQGRLTPPGALLLSDLLQLRYILSGSIACARHAL